MFQHCQRCVLIVLLLGALTGSTLAQGPLLRYPFDEGGAPASTRNFGSLATGSSPLAGHTLGGRALNGSFALTGVPGAANQVTTPFLVNLGNSSFTLGFCLNTQANNGVFQYIGGDGAGSGWRIFINGSAGVGNIRMTGFGTTLDIAGGAGATGWAHVVWAYDAGAGQVRGYLNGVATSSGAAGPLALNSGLTYLIGRHSAAATSLQAGSLVDDFRLYDRALSVAEIGRWAEHCRVEFRKVMLTEVSWGDPDGVEITNFTSAAVNLNNWRVRWQDSAGTILTSSPINVVIGANEAIVVGETGVFPGILPGVQVLPRLPSIGATSEPITVGLFDTADTVVDEVRVSDTGGAHPGFTFGGSFRGLAVRGVVSGTSFEVGVERIWGLDSNSGGDWTDQPNRSLGLENRSSGPRGTDPISIASVRITETDDSPDFIELRNNGAGSVNLQDWFLHCSAFNNSSHDVIRPFATSTSMPAGTFLVLGDGAAMPAELPGGVPYINVAPSNIPWVGSEYDCALYDRFGRLVDLMRTTGPTSEMLHNEPRAPSHWADFLGGAGRADFSGSPADDAVARISVTTDSDRGSDWAPCFGRTMGSSNTNLVLSEAGHGLSGAFQDLDVRVTEGLFTGDGNSVIINAGPTRAGATYSFFISLANLQGTGPMLGLGPDAILNYLTFSVIPPFTGTLDAQGSARYDFPIGTVPSGIHGECIFVLLQSGQLAARTLVVPFDT
jgi:hypothetical protein